MRFFKKILICQILASMGAQLPAKFQKKVMKQFLVTPKGVFFFAKIGPFLVPFYPFKAKYEFSKKILNCHFLAFMGAQLPAKFQKKVMTQF